MVFVYRLLIFTLILHSTAAILRASTTQHNDEDVVFISSIDKAAGFFFRYFAAKVTGENYESFIQPQQQSEGRTTAVDEIECFQLLQQQHRLQHSKEVMGLVWQYTSCSSLNKNVDSWWQWIAARQYPVVVIQRNPLETLIHNQKLTEFKSCIPNAVEELRYSDEMEKMVEALSCSPRIHLNLDNLVARLEQLQQQQLQLQQQLYDAGVSHIIVDFDGLVDQSTDFQLHTLQPVADFLTTTSQHPQYRVMLEDLFMEDILLSSSRLSDHVVNHEDLVLALKGSSFEQFIH